MLQSPYTRQGQLLLPSAPRGFKAGTVSAGTKQVAMMRQFTRIWQSNSSSATGRQSYGKVRSAETSHVSWWFLNTVGSGSLQFSVPCPGHPSASLWAPMAAYRALPPSPCRCYHFCHNPMCSPGIFSCLHSSQPASALRAVTAWHGTNDARAVFSLPCWQLSSREVWGLTASLSSSARRKCIAAHTVLPRDVY